MMYFIQVFHAALFNCFLLFAFWQGEFYLGLENKLSKKNSTAAGAIEEYCVPNMTCATLGEAMLRRYLHFKWNYVVNFFGLILLKVKNL